VTELADFVYDFLCPFVPAPGWTTIRVSRLSGFEMCDVNHIGSCCLQSYATKILRYSIIVGVTSVRYRIVTNAGKGRVILDAHAGVR
jgi:hypothetical protein